jgi:DNA repair protein RadC
MKPNNSFADVRVETAVRAAELFSDAAKVAGAQEGFFVLPLDYGGNVLAEPIMVSLGDKDGMAAVNPKDVFKAAFKAGADAIIVAHNHPSGVLRPSKVDLHLTEELKSRAEWLGLEFIDHIILGSSDSAKGFDFVSLAEVVL